ncbi:zf-HC2 domain-containing protein [Micromonospora sp. CPCC 205371]|nr:zf-HC2 domain-containing protein [Micromonospora sp. CPCC 205371]
MNDMLVEYAAGSLGAADRARVEEHLAGCADCRADLAGWAVLAEAAGTAAAPPGPDLVRGALLRGALSEPEPVTRRPAWFSLSLALAEARLVRVSVLVASALVMALGVVMASMPPAYDGWAGDVLALVAPVVAAAGVAGVYGPRRDPAYEVVAATPTSPRLILLTRIALVFAYDLVLAFAATGVVAAAGADPSGVWELIAAWLGPMALLSALSLVLVVWVGPDVALGVAVVLWSLRVLAGGVLVDVGGVLDVVRAAWSTNPATGLLAAGLVAVAVVFAGRGEPLRRSRATHLS